MNNDRNEIEKLIDESRRLRERATNLSEISAVLIAQIEAIEKRIEKLNRQENSRD